MDVTNIRLKSVLRLMKPVKIFKRRKFMHSIRSPRRKGISTFIATLLMMVLAISAGVMIYAYTMGYLGGVTVQPQMQSMQVQSIAEQNDEVWVYLKNTGQGVINLSDAAKGVHIYVNDKLLVDYAYV